MGNYFRSDMFTGMFGGNITRAVESLQVTFKFDDTRLSTAQRDAVGRMFHKGYGMGGVGQNQFTYLCYLLAAKPRYVLNASPANGVGLTIIDPALAEQAQTLTEETYAMSLLVPVEQIPKRMRGRKWDDEHWRACYPSSSPAAAYTPGIACFGLPAYKMRMEAKLFARHIVNALGYDEANARALNMFTRRVPLNCRLRHTSMPTNNRVGQFTIDHLVVEALGVPTNTKNVS